MSVDWSQLIKYRREEETYSVILNFKAEHSQVEAKILLLLKKIVQDVLSNKVWVQGVVYHLRSAEL